MRAPQEAQWVKNPIAMPETRVQSPGRDNPLEEGKATYSSILAWRIPWTEEPGSYSPWGCQESDTTEVTEHTHTGRNECSWEFWNYWEAFQDTFSDFFLNLPFLVFLTAVQNPQNESYLFRNHRYQSILPSKFSAGKKCLLPRIPDPHLSLFQRCLPY